MFGESRALGSSFKRRRKPAPEGAVRVGCSSSFRVSVGSRDIEQDQWPLRKAASLARTSLHRARSSPSPRAGDDTCCGRTREKSRLEQPPSNLHAARKVLNPAAGSLYLASEDESLGVVSGRRLWVDAELSRGGVQCPPFPKPCGLPGGPRTVPWRTLARRPLRGVGENRRGQLQRIPSSCWSNWPAFSRPAEISSRLETLQRSLSEEPTHEEAHTRLMRLHALSGRQQEALSQYEQLREPSPGSSVRSQVNDTRLRDEIADGRLRPPLPHGANDRTQASTT